MRRTATAALHSSELLALARSYGCLYRVVNWQEDLLFRLGQELEAYRFYQTLITQCDQELAKLLRTFPDRSAGVAPPEETRQGRRKKKRGNTPQFDLRQLLYLMSGVDLARIDGIDVITAMTVVAEAGYDMSPWPTADHFVAFGAPELTCQNSR